MRTAFTALISAIIGGLITALFLFAGVYGLKDESDSVTIKEVAPQESSEAKPVFSDGS